jgi:hypothetical protein
MEDPAELELVYRAILSRTTGDCEWEDRAAERVRKDPALKGYTPELIKRHLREYVDRKGQGVIRQRPETRGYDRPYWYKVVIEELAEFKRGLFVEIVLADEDPENPAVWIVNAHE